MADRTPGPTEPGSYNDCEDHRSSSVTVLGCVAGDPGRDPHNDWPRAFGLTRPLVVAGTGPVGVAGPIRSSTTRSAPGVSRHSPAVSSRTGDRHVPSRQGDERMAMPAELVDVVVGVDTHKHTHTAAVVSASTGGVLDEAM